MTDFAVAVSWPILLAGGIMLVAAVLVWLLCGHGIDKLKHPDEWSSKGSAGERAVWLTLTKKYHIPEDRIFRNVYVPIGRNRMTEIDMVVVSRKGLLVFECKNYAGRIYGDGQRSKWVQYVGSKKSYFLSPVMQNRMHVKHLYEYFKDIPDLPIIPFTVTTQMGNWKLKNVDLSDHVLGWSGQSFWDIYRALPDAQCMSLHYHQICLKLKQLERPVQSIREEHIKRVKHINHS